MLQVRNGEVEMLGVLFDRYQAPLFNFYAKMTQDRAVSEDLVQEVFLRILRYRQTYRPGTNFRTWMYQIARNTRIDQVRKIRPESPFTSEPLAPTAFADSAQQLQEAALLQTALMHLPEDKREILILSRFQELKYDEIALLLGCEVGAVKVRVHRALQQLREIFLQLESGPRPIDSASRSGGFRHSHKPQLPPGDCNELRTDRRTPTRLSAKQPGARASSQVEQHCEHCANCAQDVAMWKKLALLPPDQPSPDSRARFDAMLHAYSQQRVEARS